MFLNLNNPSADVFVPDGQPLDAALGRISHLGIGAHQDDLEFMALHGIAACYESEAEWFGGVHAPMAQAAPDLVHTRI